MKPYLKQYTMTIKTLGPVFIGSGQQIGKKEYVYDRNKGVISFFDTKKLFKGLRQLKKYDDYVDFILGDNKDLYTFFHRNRISPQIYKKWFLYSEDVYVDYTRNMNIMTFMKDPYHKPYIPGSSLKGTIRTILECDYFLNNPNEAHNYAVQVKDENRETNIRKNKFLTKTTKSMDVRVFHKPMHIDEKHHVDIRSIQNDIFSGLIISDSEPLNWKNLSVYQKVDLLKNGNEKQINILRECIKPGTDITFDISIDPKVFNYTPKQIENAIVNFGNNYYDEFYKKFVDSPAFPGGPVFYLGGGSGYPTKTLTYSIMHDKEAVIETAKIIDHTLSRKVKQQHKHDQDAQLGVSPHTLKSTFDDDTYFQMGACLLTEFKERND